MRTPSPSSLVSQEPTVSDREPLMELSLTSQRAGLNIELWSHQPFKAVQTYRAFSTNMDDSKTQRG